jgi:hypothetical protein
MTALSKPWKISLQCLVDAIDQAFVDIRDISHYHGLLEGHANLAMSRESLNNGQKSIAMQERSLERLFSLEQKIEEVHANFVRFPKEHDVQQTADFIRQRVDESFEEAERSPTSTHLSKVENEDDREESVTSTDSMSLDSLCNDVFIELRDFRLNLSRQTVAIEESADLHEHKARQKNLLRMEKVLAWVEAESSQLLWINGNNVLRRSEFSILFATPLLVLGEGNHESTLVLRHFCAEHTSQEVKHCRLLVQTLIFQTLQRYPHILSKRKASLNRECMTRMSTLWDLFLGCLNDAAASCTFIVIDSIDSLGKGATTDDEDANVLIDKMNSLVRSGKQLVKILLTASLAKEAATSSNNSMALTTSSRKATIPNAKDDPAIVSQRLLRFQEKRRTHVTFSELAMLYIPNTTVYTVQDGHLRAYVVAELSGMDWGTDSYGSLRLRVWNIDHDGRNIARRYRDLKIPQFGAERAIESLTYVPTGYLANETEQRQSIIARGQKWWEYSVGVHHVTVGEGTQQVCLFS